MSKATRQFRRRRRCGKMWKMRKMHVWAYWMVVGWIWTEERGSCLKQALSMMISKHRLGHQIFRFRAMPREVVIHPFSVCNVITITYSVPRYLPRCLRHPSYCVRCTLPLPPCSGRLEQVHIGIHRLPVMLGSGHPRA